MSSFRMLISCCLLAAPLLAHAQDGESTAALEIEGMNVKQTLECQGRDVNLSGEGNTLTLKGRCGQIAIYGAHHRLVVDDADSITIHGLGSVTTVRGGVAALSIGGGDQRVVANVRAAPGTLAKVDAYGNRVQAQLILLSEADVAVGGSSQQVYWSRAAGIPLPKTLVSGNGNVLAANPDVPTLNTGGTVGLNAIR